MTTETLEDVLPLWLAEDIYAYLLKEFNEHDQSIGEVVVSDVRPFFNRLCAHIGKLHEQKYQTAQINSRLDSSWDNQSLDTWM